MDKIIIVGAGIAGLTSALAIRKNLTRRLSIEIYEIRSVPSTIGGAVNLTPKALRYLSRLGVYDTLISRDLGAACSTIDLRDLYSGQSVGQLSFAGPEGTGIGKTSSDRFIARRVDRSDLQRALLDAVDAQEGIKIVWGKKAVKIEESDEVVRLTFEDGDVATADLLLGADGIHSVVRTLLVDPERQPTYSGVAVSIAHAKLRPGTKLPWETTAVVTSRMGSLMCSFHEPGRTSQYIAAVKETPEGSGREAWKARGADQQAIKAELLDRFKSDNLKEVSALIEDAGEFSLYPVYTLPPNGKWISDGGRSLLIGDAAHAMAPQGESTGICIEDAVVFSRALMQHETKSIPLILHAYQAYRRQPIENHVKMASYRWENVKDAGWLKYQIKLIVTPYFIWWMKTSMQREFEEDLSTVEFDIED